MDIEEFYAADERRRKSAELEFGRDWNDENGRCGVSWIDGREIGPDVANRRWTTGLVLLSELRSTFDQLKHRQSRLDRLADDPPRVLDIGPGEQPIIIGCDHDFQHAMELGLDSVYAYITAVLQERATSAAHLLER